MGNEGDDCLFGGKENDFLNGGDGNDSLYGDRDPDLLIGGLGEDIFFIGRSTGGQNINEADIVADFSLEQGDQIGLLDDLNFGDLELEDTVVEDFDGVILSGTAIRIDDSDDERDYLIILDGVTPGELSSSDFITI